MNRNLGEPLLPCANPTNNIAELQAVTKAIKLAKKQGSCTFENISINYFLYVYFSIKKLRNCSYKNCYRFQYVKDGMESWIVNWMENGWKTANGSQVANKKMWEELLVLVKGINIKWVSVIEKTTKYLK